MYLKHRSFCCVVEVTLSRKHKKGLRKRLNLSLIVKAKIKHLELAKKWCLQNITTFKKNQIFNLCKITRLFIWNNVVRNYLVIINYVLSFELEEFCISFLYQSHLCSSFMWKFLIMCHIICLSASLSNVIVSKKYCVKFRSPASKFDNTMFRWKLFLSLFCFL